MHSYNKILYLSVLASSGFFYFGVKAGQAFILHIVASSPFSGQALFMATSYMLASSFGVMSCLALTTILILRWRKWRMFDYSHDKLAVWTAIMLMCAAYEYGFRAAFFTAAHAQLEPQVLACLLALLVRVEFILPASNAQT